MMLSGRVRVLATVAGAWFQPTSLVSRVPFTVMPWDVDLNVHLTNSRYPQIMDIGRADLLVRSGLAKRMFSEKVGPVAVEVRTRFRHELPLFCRYELETKIIGRERKAVIFQQRFMVGERVHAVGRVKVVTLKGGKVVEPTFFEPLLLAAELDGKAD